VRVLVSPTSLGGNSTFILLACPVQLNPYVFSKVSLASVACFVRSMCS
jgi:hypothetical protein